MTITYSARKTGKIDPRIEKIFAPLKDLKHLQVFLHGSLADNTSTSFSDIDDFVIIDDTKLSEEEIAVIEKVLKEVENEFFRFDPLQHHGHWKIYKSQLADYNNSLLPIFILENAITIVGSNKIQVNINVNQSHYTLFNHIKSHCIVIDKYFKDYVANNLNIHKLKAMVGSIALLVPLLFQLKGKKIEKRYAIQNAKELFCDKAITLIEWTTEIRENWGQLLNNNEYLNFISKQQKVPLSEWRDFANNNAPIINSHPYTTIQPNAELIKCFIEECVAITDSISVQQKTIEDYKNAYSSVEKFAIKNNAILVGQFGEIKHPGISDLDVFVCYTDEDYKAGEQQLREFIQDNDEFIFYFTHPPICISESMLPYLPYLHTISNLNISFNKNNIYINSFVPKYYTETLNILWTLFIFPGAEHELNHLGKVCIRDLLLRLKNIHTSIDNLNRQSGTISNEIENSDRIRQLVFVDPTKARRDAETEYKSAYGKLIHIESKNRKRYYVVGRKLLLKTGVYGSTKENGLTILSFPNSLFSIVRDYLCYANNKNLNTYVQTFEQTSEISIRLGVNNPMVFLLRNYTNMKPSNTFKKHIYKALSFLPYNVTKNLLSS